jgi:predicted metal-dependent hydrolase
MDDSSIERLRDELLLLFQENLERLEKQVFMGITPEEFRQQKERLERIREVSAELLGALERTLP